jgi:acetyl-CoA synthetase
VGQQDPVTGEAIFAFVILKGAVEPTKSIGEELRQHVARKIGAIARPKHVLLTPDLPKTRSGKIMRRLLRDIANGRQLGDTTTLADTSVVETIRAATGKGEEDQA